MTQSCDVAIVGAGIVGAACAYYLSLDGLRVVVIDAGFPGCGATAAGMGHLVVMDDSPAQFALTAYSVRLWTELSSRLGPEVEMDPCGTLWCATSDEEMAAAGEKQVAYAEAGIDASLLNSPDLRQVEPNLSDKVIGGLRIPGDMVVYPVSAATWMLNEARSHGARVLSGRRAERIELGEVFLEGGDSVRASIAINACGANASELTPHLPIKPRKGHLAITDRISGLVRHQVLELGYLKSAHGGSASSVAFNVQPRATGQMLIGSSREYVGWDGAINRRLLKTMLDSAIRFLPAIATASIVRVWTGFRPATPDKLPLIGPHESNPQLLVAAGHEGLGIATSLATGKILADQIAGRTPEIDPTPYLPSRFSLVGGASA